MAIKILPCKANQVKLLQGVAIETFRQTYSKYNDPKNFEVYIATAFNEQQLLKELTGRICKEKIEELGKG